MIRNTILFDMDGVLINSENAMATSGIDALKMRGISAKREDFTPFTGMGEDAFIGGVAEKYGLKYDSSIKDDAYAIYASARRNLIEVFDGICDMILELKRRGYRIAVASAADFVKVKINLSCIGFDVDDFEAVVTGSDIEKNKPNPEIYLKAAEAVGADVSECIVVEDAVAGIEAGLAANMICIGIASTFDRDILLRAGAAYAVYNTPELLDVVGRL